MGGKNSRINVLITGAGGSGTIYLLKHLKKNPIFRTIVVDMNKYAVGLYIADKGYVVPSTESPDYFKKIAQIIRKEKIRVAVPLIDEELLGFQRLKQKIPNLEVLTPTKEFIETVIDKLRMSTELRKKGIPVAYAEQFKINSIKLKFPFVIKPKSSRGSRGFQVIHNKNELKKYLKNTAFAPKQLMLQRLVEGKEFTVSAVVDKKGKLHAVVPKEIVIKKGITQVGVTRANKKIGRLCEQINREFNPRGPFNVQLIIDKKDGIPYVFEINPRYSTTVSLTMEAGVDEISAMILDRVGKKFTLNKKFRKNHFLIRYTDQIFVEQNKIIKAF